MTLAIGWLHDGGETAGAWLHQAGDWHAGGPRTDATFRTYPNGGAAGPNVSTTSGLQLPVSRPRLRKQRPQHSWSLIAQSVSSVWTAQQPTTNVPVARMYSPGKVVCNDLSSAVLWSVPARPVRTRRAPHSTACSPRPNRRAPPAARPVRALSPR
jgi:hypothetical protein